MNKNVASRFDALLDELYSRLKMSHDILKGHVQNINDHVVVFL